MSMFKHYRNFGSTLSMFTSELCVITVQLITACLSKPLTVSFDPLWLPEFHTLSTTLNNFISRKHSPMTFTNALESLITSRNVERAVGLTVLNDAEKRCRKFETTFPSEQSLL